MRTLQAQIGWCARAQWVMGVTVVVAAAAVFLLGHRPASRRLAELEMQVETKAHELQANESRAQVRHIVERKVNDLRRKLNRFDKKLPRQQELDEFLRELDHLSQQSALRGYVFETAVPQHRDLLVELPLKLKFSGDFLSTFSFLRQMAQMERLTRVRALDVRGVRNEPGQVAVEVSMSIYFSEG